MPIKRDNVKKKNKTCTEMFTGGGEGGNCLDWLPSLIRGSEASLGNCLEWCVSIVRQLDSPTLLHKIEKR